MIGFIIVRTICVSFLLLLTISNYNLNTHPIWLLSLQLSTIYLVHLLERIYNNDNNIGIDDRLLVDTNIHGVDLE